MSKIRVNLKPEAKSDPRMVTFEGAMKKPGVYMDADGDYVLVLTPDDAVIYSPEEGDLMAAGRMYEDDTPLVPTNINISIDLEGAANL